MSDPHVEYSQRLETHLQQAAGKNRLHIRIGNAKLAVVAVGLLLAWLALHKDLFSSQWLLAPAVAYALLGIVHELVLRAKNRADTSANLYRRGLARIEDRWAGSGQSGDRFRDENHVYADDLDLFGKGCLFELLSTARLPMGEGRLANWLKNPAPLPEILERQAQVAELREKLDLHRDLAVTAEDLRARLDPESLTGWCEAGRVLPGTPARIVVVLLAFAAAAATAYCTWATVYWPLLAVLIVEWGVRRWLLKPANRVIEGIACNAEGLLLFADILQRLEREDFRSPRLREFTAELMRGPEPASRSVRRLARIVYWIDGSHSLLGHILELPLLYSLQTAFAAEAWRKDCGQPMRSWVHVAAEMEALVSLATYSYEHPADPFPVFDQGAAPQSALFDGQDLGHPLIPDAQCVRNSVKLDAATRVLLISGSNMSGKSTLLRVVGINTVLAMAGAPVRAKSLRLTPLSVGTRLRGADSLQQGRSTFYTEILHIRRVFDLAKENLPLLFLFDELLEGTNSKDRRIGAESLLRALLQRGAIGMVTTHDLALTEIISVLGTGIRNQHFEDQVVEGKMRFDYRLRDGVVAKSNAIELMRLIGLEM